MLMRVSMCVPYTAEDFFLNYKEEVFYVWSPYHYQYDFQLLFEMLHERFFFRIFSNSVEAWRRYG